MTPVRLILCTRGTSEAGPLVRLLASERIDVRTRLPGEPGAGPPGLAQLVVLVDPDPATGPLGETAFDLRKVLGAGVAIVACTPARGPSEREVLFACGVETLLAPRSWAPEHVVERILSEVYRRRLVEPWAWRGVVGTSAEIRRACAAATRLAPLGDTVVITGETGSGKDVLATAIHQESGRPGELLAVNCASLPRDLVESELFGHLRGSFTGAAAREGILLAAGKGTVFLDEVGELPLDAQARLLRVVDDRRVRPVGSDTHRPLEARLILATNRDLVAECAAGRFREDLLHRINALEIHLPPLRERRADIPLLAEHFAEQVLRERGRAGGFRFPPFGFDWLVRRPWSGNVRELRNVIVKATAFADPETGELQEDALRSGGVPTLEPARGRDAVPFDASVDTLADVEARARKAYLRAVLDAVGGDKQAAMERAGVKRTRFYELLKETGEG